MDEPKKEPLLFANRAIQQYAKPLLDADERLTAEDCTVIRVGFRDIGGTWEELTAGDHRALDKLSQVVKAWGRLRAKKT